MNTAKKFASFILILCMVLSMVPCTVLTADATNDFTVDALTDAISLDGDGIPYSAPDSIENNIDSDQPTAIYDAPRVASTRAGETVRYSVLVLDTSASSSFKSGNKVIYVADTAVDYVKASAKKFISDVQKANGINYVAVVEYKGTESKIASGFTTDYDTLNQTIDELYSSGSTRSVAYGLEKANLLLDEITEPNAIKNVVLFTTGMTNEGPYSYSGRYDENTVGSDWRRSNTQVHLYAYSNSAIAEAEKLKKKATLYTVGLFQVMEDMPQAGHDVVELFKLFSKDTATSEDYFYDVKDPAQLEFVFGKIADDITTVPIVAGGNTLNVLWDDEWFNGTPIYNHDLAVTSAALSWAAYSKKNIKNALMAFGFDEDKIKQGNYDDNIINHSVGDAGYTLASKPISAPDGDYVLVAVIVRGSADISDWVTDLIGLLSDGATNYAGFQSAYLDLRVNLEFYISEQGYESENLKFYITGHSLGAAVSGLLANDLSAPQNSNNVFCYTFASPNTSKLTVARDNIFNIVSMCDVITRVPYGYQRHGVDKTVPDALGDSSIQGKYLIPSYRSKKMMDLYKKLKGETYRPLTRDGTDSIIAGGYLSIAENILIPEVRSRLFTTHSACSYYCWLASCTEDELFGSFHSAEPTVTLGGKWVSIKCPVDVYVRDTSGVIIASAVDEEVVEPGLSISVRDGEKTFFMFNDQDYKIEIIAREKGTVSYEVEEITITGTDCSALRTVTFEDIEIEKGDTLTGDIDDPFSIPATDYALTKKSGDTIGVILPDSDSSGTISGFSVTFDPKGGSLTTEMVAIGEDGKFAELPTASRDGYTFNGWYTSEEGGSRITTDTVFTQDATVYAQWTKDSSSSGGSSGGSGSPSVPTNPSYPIKVADAANGAVTVTPTSAEFGSSITITAVPDADYTTGKVTVTDLNGKSVSVTDNGDGTYTFTMPASLATVSVTFERINRFTDVSKGSWYYDAVDYVARKDLMRGTSTTIFEPNTATTRAMIVTILYRLEKSPAAGNVSFDDVNAGTWYTDAVAWASANGIVKGYGNGKFGPGDPITREQVAAILYRYAEYKGYDISGQADLTGYTDAKDVSGWALTAMRWANDAGLITGRTAATLAPDGTTNRAEAAAILMRFCQKVAGLE